MDLTHLKRAFRHLSPRRYLRALNKARWDLEIIREQLNRSVELARVRILTIPMGADDRYTHPLSLARHHGQVYSQNGEDGMLAEIFRRIGLPEQPFFVEIGIENGQQNNTRLLVEQGWNGVWIDGSANAVAEARHTFAEFIQVGTLRIIHSLVNAENINALLEEAGVPDNITLLSLDIDQNTSYVWRAIRRRTQVACIEYNASLPPSIDVEVPYDPFAVWDETNWFGASLKALERIGTDKGLSLVGCDFIGANAFFVVDDQARGKFREPFTAETHYEFPKYPVFGHSGHPPSRQAKRWVSPRSRPG